MSGKFLNLEAERSKGKKKKEKEEGMEGVKKITPFRSIMEMTINLFFYRYNFLYYFKYRPRKADSKTRLCQYF
jgi:hypothetical protein